MCVCEWESVSVSVSGEKAREVNALWLACLRALQSGNIIVDGEYWNFSCLWARIQGQRAKFRGSMLGIHLQDGYPDSVLWG